MFRTMLQTIGVVGIAIFTILVFATPTTPEAPEIAYIRPVEATPILESSTTTAEIEESTPEKEVQEVKAKPKPPEPESEPVDEVPSPPAAEESLETTSTNEVRRTLNPYSLPPLSQNELDVAARAAIVNIYCESKGGPLSSISGSGVIIDPRGVILTNAHVAQYVLLASDPQINLSCFIRSGSPAQNRWAADILYFPPAWIEKHASDIAQTRPKGTGEYDYALLVIRESVGGNPLPSSIPYASIDTREAIAFTSDQVLLAGYPTEFAGRGTTRSSLYPTSVFTRIGDLLTFTERSVDLISLGSVPLAQSGSSGGAVINLWGHVVGIITTTSEGETTGERELRAITLSYVDRNIQSLLGVNLSLLLAGDVRAKAAFFMANEAPTLAQKIISHIP